MGSFSIWHWLIVLAIVMLVFGTKKLRNFGADLGGAVRGFKDGMQESAMAGRADFAETPPSGNGKLIDGALRERSGTDIER